MKEFYLDYAATTPIDKRVLSFAKSYLEKSFENPSSMHHHGIKNRKAINEARKKVADALYTSANEIYFTSGGTESINWAIKGYALKHPKKTEIITSSIEHEATLKTLGFLDKQGYVIHYLKVDGKGFIDLKDLENKINENTLMVTLILANNEIGTIQDIKSISKICEKHEVKLHVDAVQAFGQVDINLSLLDIDFLTISSHKFYGPKGIGVLYIKNGTDIEPLIHGGSQELYLRAGTENLFGIVGMGEAARLIKLEQEETQKKYQIIQEDFYQKILESFTDVRLIGAPCGPNRSFNHLAFAFKNIKGQNFQFQLNKRGVFVSTGSACHEQLIKPSHVITAISLEDGFQTCVLRITFGKDSKLKDNYEIIKRFKEAYQEVKE